TLTRSAQRAGGSTAVDRIAVREDRLNYDPNVEGTRAVREVRASYDARVAAGEALSRFTAPASFSGQDVVYFREQRSAAAVEWYVLHRNGQRLLVGCQYDRADEDAVQRACEQVVGSLRTR